MPKLYKKTDNEKQIGPRKTKMSKHTILKLVNPQLLKSFKNTFESRFIADYRVLEIVNDCTLIVQSANGKTRQININDAKAISAKAVTDNALQDFKQAAMKKEHIHPYHLRRSAK